MHSVKRALIFGVSGQDGAYLSRLLLDRGYEVHGASRDAESQSFHRLVTLGIRDRVVAHSAVARDFRELLQLIGGIRPDEIYNLAGQSSVGLSFSQPVETMDSIAQATLVMLEVIRYLKLPVRLYNSASSECFGETPPGNACDELTPFFPRSPYATAKAAAHWTTVNYREAYGIYACSGILFNHESPLRSERFVTRKIFTAAAEIAAGTKRRLTLGRLDVSRDWGYAAEYVEAMWRMLQQDEAQDFVIATGESHTLEELTAAAFAQFNLDWHDHVDIDPSLFRASEIAHSRGNPENARRVLGWEAETKFAELVKLLADTERRT
ncbi:MAG: GDPmannose 4,6-dehydratase [Thermoanaerobaculia bacterium]|jgi:GDPmannose 4,6-dehydratase|nr:GDPmannose 4,6-dehydratase [Thermoanaerobaculia bacterium]